MIIPESKCKVGSALYSATGDVYNDGSVSVDINVWVITAVRKLRRDEIDRRFGVEHPVYIHLTRKTKYTWVKERGTGTNSKFIWAKSISKLDKYKFEIGKPANVFTTVLAALKSEKQRHEASRRRCFERANAPDIEKDEAAEWEEEVSMEDKIIKAIKTRITKLKR